MKFLSSYGIAFILILFVAGWLITGTLIEGGKGPGKGEKSIVEMIKGSDEQASSEEKVDAKQEESQEEEKLQSVRTVVFNAQAMPISVSLRGRTKASTSISVAAQTSGIIETIHVSKGDVVKLGDLLCTIESGTRQAQIVQGEASIAQAKASLAQVEADFATNKNLREKGLAAANTARSFEVQLQAAKSSLAAAKAALAGAELELSRTKIHAKISGIVQDPLANVGDMMNIGATCATLVQLDPILFAGKIAEAKVSLIQIGMNAKITTINMPPIKGFKHHEGEVIYVSPSADEATRSFNVEIKIANPNNNIRAGLSASAIVNAGETVAHLIPQSALTLASDGTIGVKIVDEQDVVHFKKVTLVNDDTKGVWVLGLPDIAQMIIFGQEYVVDGQLVAPTLVSGEAL